MKRITVRSKALVLDAKAQALANPAQGAKAEDTAICTKIGMSVRVRSDDMVVPDIECYFYVRLSFPWNRADGSEDYEEIITDGDDFFIAFRTLGKQRFKWTEAVQDVVLGAIYKFVEELNK